MQEKQFKSNLSDEAYAAIERGWSIFPLSIATKTPLDVWREFQTRTPSLDELDDWFDNGAPTSSGKRADVFNLALVTGSVSGLVVVDCDTDEAVAYAKKHGLSSPFTVKTKRGMHFYHAHPGHGQRFTNKVGGVARDWPDISGLDFRGDGGYVVLPGSIRGQDNFIYTWEIGIGIDWDDLDLFVWKGVPTEVDPPQPGEFSFGSLSLAGVKTPNPTDGLPVWEQASARVAHLGRKLTEGDGTDNWMMRFCGQKVRLGLTGEPLHVVVRKFYDEFFEDAYDEKETQEWLNRKIESAVQMDARNYPEDYEDGKRVEKVEKVETPTERLRPIFAGDVERLIAEMGDTEYWVDPLVPAETITQVVGYNGHGKSLFLYALLTSMSSACPDFGPFGLGRPAKVFYLDYDNPRKTVLSRFRLFNEMFGDSGERMAIWSPALISSDDGGEMNLGTEEGFRLLGQWMDVVSPDVVVIDTVRNAFGGLEEATASEWYRVNHVAKTIRTAHRASVVLVHHRNKPGEHGLGREAGSTAQLTDVDTQVMVTLVLRDKLESKAKAGLLDTDLQVQDITGRYWTPWGYLEKQLEDNSRLRMVTQISFGKVRVETEMHQTQYLGWAERLTDGSQYIVSTKSPKQRARHLYRTGSTPTEISQKLYLPAQEVREWLGVEKDVDRRFLHLITNTNSVNDYD